MKRSMFAIGVLVLSGVATGCRMKADVPPPAQTVTDACAAALAAARQDTEMDRAIGRAQARARAGTGGKEPLERLGYLYVSRARAAHDAGDYKLAEMTAECLTTRHPGSTEALLLRGHVLHQLHRFREAEQIARALVSTREVALDFGLLGDTLMEQGRLTEAAAAYQRMVDLKPFYQSYVRAAHLRWMRGDLDGAIELIRLAIGSASPRDPESAAWAWTRLAAYELQAGRARAAAAAADAALERQPDYAAALIARGRALLAMNRTAEAVEALVRAARLNPLPEYQWTLADALRLRGLARNAEPIERELTTNGAATDPRTLALFLATRRSDPGEALRLVEEELHVRQDVFTLDAHAWALAANGQIAQAREVMARAVGQGTEDGRLFLHAGVIDLAAGRRGEARRWLKKAEHLRAMLLPSESAELSRHLIEIRQ